MMRNIGPSETYPVGEAAWELPLTVIEAAQPAGLEPLAARDFNLDSVDVYTNTGCNRRCHHCFLSDKQLADKSFMSLETIGEIINWSQGEGSGVREITLLGGEFALHPQAAEIIRTIDDAGLGTRIVTNGSEPFRRLLDVTDTVDVLRKNRVAVSLEAADAAVNDAIRGRGAFQDTLLAVQDLRSKGVPFDINCTVTRANQSQVPELLELAAREGAGRVNLHWFSRVGRATNARSDIVLGKQLTKDEWLDTVMVARQWKGFRPNSNMAVDCELGYQYELPGQDLTMCAVRDKTNLQFAPGGSVTACGLLMDRPDMSGYVFRGGQLFKRLGSNELTQTAVACEGCPIRPAISGNAALCIYNRLA